MIPDFGTFDYDDYDNTDYADARAERDQIRREAAADAKELRETGWDAAGERAEFEAEVRGGLL